VDTAKPFDISKRQVWEAYQRVQANQGAAGVDGQSIAAFEEDLEDNLYKLWNRLASGSYFPPPVRRVEIPKGDGSGTRPLGIPTVADRVAQAVVKAYLEPELERHFHPDSYGYRLGKSALEAVGVARQRCWRYDWVLDLDIRHYFDSIDHALLMRAVRKHTDCKWVLLYIERWLNAPAQLEDGTLEPREQGTPQGSVRSPPCGVPFGVACHLPSSTTPTVSHWRMSFNTRRSLTRRCTSRSSRPWSMVSKKS
jgi:RNA-directed DNA polymerase